MKRNFISLFLLLIIFQIKGQDIMVEYQEIYHNYRITNYTLHITDSLSLWQVMSDNYKAQIKDTTVMVNNNPYNTYEVIRMSNPVYDEYPHKKFVLKNYNKHKINTTEVFRSKRYYISDSLGNIQWKLTDKTKEILGYKCNSATANFRGREYIVYYTDEIPVSEGPWKLYGLPGLILEAYTKDGEYAFKANKIILNYPNPIKLPVFSNDEVLSWKKLNEKIIKFQENRISSRRARAIRENEKGSLRSKISRIEVIHPIFSPEGVIIFNHTKK